MSGILASIISEELTNGCLIPHSSTTPPPVFHRPLCSFFWFLKAFDLGTYLLVLSSQFSFLSNNIMYIQPTIKDWQKPRLGSSFVCNVVPCTKRLRVRSLIGGQPIDISPSLSLKSINMSTHVRIKKKGLARNGHMLLLTVAVSWWWRYRWFLWNTFHFLVSVLPFIWNTYDQGEKHFLNGKLQDNAFETIRIDGTSAPAQHLQSVGKGLSFSNWSLGMRQAGPSLQLGEGTWGLIILLCYFCMY